MRLFSPPILVLLSLCTVSLSGKEGSTFEVQTGSYSGTFKANQDSDFSLIPINIRYKQYLETGVGTTAFGISANFDYVSYTISEAKKTGWLNAAAGGIEGFREVGILRFNYGVWIYPYGALSVSSKSTGPVNGIEISHTSILTLSNGKGYELFASVSSAYSGSFFTAQNQLLLGLGFAYFNMGFTQKTDQTLASGTKIIAKETRPVNYSVTLYGVALILGLTL